MRRPGSFPRWFCAGVLLACLACAVPTAGASLYERLRPGDCFVARQEQGELRYEACLRLLSRHFFEFSESFTYKKQAPFRRVLTGLWFQIRGGSLLWLYNRYGLSRPFNVGGEKALYGDMPLPGGRGSLSVIFRPDAPADGPLRLMGAVRRADGGLTFTESASGLVFSLAAPLPQELQGQPLPLFLELEARLASGARLVVDRILALNTRLPSGLEDAPRALSAVTDSAPWLLELPDGRQFSASFFLDPASEAPPAPAGEQTVEAEALPPAGRLDLAGDGLYLSLSLFLRGQELRLALSGNERAMLHLLGLDALCDMLLALRRWELHGSLLVLYDAVAPRCWLSRRRGEP